MKFFFPDSQDLVDPSFDFLTEERAEYRIRQRDDLYAHEVLTPVPFDGILVSKAIVDGVGAAKSGKYSLAQKHRLRRIGVREFFRAQKSKLKFLGDCGAFSYKDEEVPPFSVDEVVEFYAECGFDFGVSVDHLVLQFDANAGDYLPGFEPDYSRAKGRQQLTLDLAADFMKRQKGCGFSPVGVAQGWSAKSYADAVRQLQRMGYRYIALGSMVPLKSADILHTLEAVDVVRRVDTKLHLLGVTRLEHMKAFSKLGVSSFDSTSPFLQAFKDDRDNYHTADAAFTAIRVPQVDGNPRLQRRISAGITESRAARRHEQVTLALVRAYAKRTATLAVVLESLRSYAELTGEERDRTEAYERTLSARPWEKCECAVCLSVGIEVALFRGSERNKRRGFHNLHVFGAKLHTRRGLPRAHETVLA